MRALQKLVRNGNATGVSIPREFLFRLSWLPGQSVIVEEVDGKSLIVRLPAAQDFGIRSAPRILDDDPPAERA